MEALSKVPKVITPKNFYAILSLLVIAALAVWGFIGYKIYLADKAAKRSFDALSKLPGNEFMLDFDIIDKNEFMTKVSAALRKLPIKSLMDFNNQSDEFILDVFKGKYDKK